MKNLSLALLVGMLTACSSSDNLVKDSLQTWEAQFTDEVKLTEKLRTDQIKPTSLDNLPFQMASLESSNRIHVTAESPVVSFPEGNSFVSAIFLPEHINRFTFVLESDAGSTVFVPSVIFLDENLQEVSRVDNAQFDPMGYFSIERKFSQEEADAIRFILVYSKDSNLDGKTEVVNPAREYEIKKGNAVSDVIHPRLYAKHSPIGRLNIRFDDVFYSAEAIHKKLITEENDQKKTMIPSTEEAPTILSDTEAFYLQQISKALKDGNESRAKILVEEAVRAGSKKAIPHYMEELKKLQ